MKRYMQEPIKSLLTKSKARLRALYEDKSALCHPATASSILVSEMLLMIQVMEELNRE